MEKTIEYKRLPKKGKLLFLKTYKEGIVTKYKENTEVRKNTLSFEKFKRDVLERVNTLANFYFEHLFEHDLFALTTYENFQNSAINNDIFSGFLDSKVEDFNRKVESSILTRKELIEIELKKLSENYALSKNDSEVLNNPWEFDNKGLVLIFKKLGYKFCREGEGVDFYEIRYKILFYYGGLGASIDFSDRITSKDKRTFISMFYHIVDGFATAHFEKNLMSENMDIRINDTEKPTKGNSKPYKLLYLLMNHFGMFESKKYEDLTAVKQAKLLSIIFNLESEGIRQDLSKVNKFIHEKNNKTELEKLINEVNTAKLGKRKK